MLRRLAHFYADCFSSDARCTATALKHLSSLLTTLAYCEAVAASCSRSCFYISPNGEKLCLQLLQQHGGANFLAFVPPLSKCITRFPKKRHELCGQRIVLELTFRLLRTPEVHLSKRRSALFYEFFLPPGEIPRALFSLRCLRGLFRRGLVASKKLPRLSAIFAV